MTPRIKQLLDNHQIEEAFFEAAKDVMNNVQSQQDILRILRFRNNVGQLRTEVKKIERMAQDGNPYMLYALARIHDSLQIDKDSPKIAFRYFTKAVEAGIADARAFRSFFFRDGDMGETDLEKYQQEMQQALDDGSQKAAQQLLHDRIFGAYGQTKDPERAYQSISNYIAREEVMGHDVDPYYYHLLADADTELGRTQSAIQNYETAARLGDSACYYWKAMTAYIDENFKVSDYDKFQAVMEQARDARAAESYLYFALVIDPSEYEELSAEDQKGVTTALQEQLPVAYALGSSVAANFMGSFYEMGSMGFEIDYEKAFGWYSRGARLHDSACFNQMVRMILDDQTAPSDMDEAYAYECAYRSLMLGDEQALPYVVRGYRRGYLVDHASAIERLYLPRFDQSNEEADDDAVAQAPAPAAPVRPAADTRFCPTLELERRLSEQIYNALQGKVVEDVLRKLGNTKSDAYWRSNMEGHSLKVERDLLPDIYEMCIGVKTKLGVTDPVDFYITGDSSVNAFSVASEDENQPHIVNINSGLLSLMNPDELRFVIGHELGHLINRDTALARLIHFIFPPETTMPPVTLQYKIRLHEQLAELVADRYGYLAAENVGACITAFFKMASGLDLIKMNVSIDALLADNNRRLSYFLNDKGVSRASHPVNPIRVQALNLFATAQTEEQLTAGMDQLISILMKVGDSELDEYTARFIATAGLIAANADGNVEESEVNQIIGQLASLKIFPRQFLDEVAQGDVQQIFQESVMKILEINPGMREGMLSYMISVILSNKEVKSCEIDLLYQFGTSIGLSEVEVAQAIALHIQRDFVPSLDAIC